MSVSVQQLLADVRRLAGRLREHDSSADLLLLEAQAMHRQVDAMKEYQEELMELNQAAHHRPHVDLIANIVQENQQLQTLESENRELKSALEEHQNTLELVMSKYRQQVSRLLDNPNQGGPDSIRLPAEHNTALVHQAEEINDVMAVMRRAALMDDELACRDSELYSNLMTENRGLKELLDIGMKHGSIGASGLLQVEQEDKQVQTEASAEDSASA